MAIIAFSPRPTMNGETPLYLAVQAAAERFLTQKDLIEMKIGNDLERFLAHKS